ncbi:hypothetical protein Pst134EA_019431 [Puccinia striiformis f. sp. tritici]|uniref:hypothetical protein n=1 Tax=Puccinia striiformis f. sp. tritici TaxID=168172 RepID=UPI002008CF67|nr:hypothetical protein Pst134EA_019431 [Puccinia striiformis f. sp. tritici]KAH9459276.1 hypothetical protein Pst134EA_019431 [Puccinia striiformis f. sp. tritici]
MPRPSADCLDRLENQANAERVRLLTNQLEPQLVQASKLTIELKAHQKLTAEAEKNARSDPNSQHWLNQIEEKSARQSQVQQAINQTLAQAVQHLDHHIRTEVIGIFKALLSDGFFDKPGKNSKSNSDPNPSSVVIKTLAKNVDNERKEREESITTLRRELDQDRVFNSNRLKELQETFEQYKLSNETRFKNLEDTHRQQISSLKAGLQISRLNNQQQQNSPQPPVEQPDPQQLKKLIQEQLKEQLPATRRKSDIPTTDFVSKQSFQIAINQIRDLLGRLGQQTTETLQEFEPKIKQVTNGIQAQVIKSTKTVISDGHKDIALLIQESLLKLEDELGQIRPIVESSTEKIKQLESTHSTLETQITGIQPSLASQIEEKLLSKLDSQIDEQVNTKLDSQINERVVLKLDSQIKQNFNAKFEALEALLGELKQKCTQSDTKHKAASGLQSSIAKVQNKQNGTAQSITKIQQTLTDVQTQFKEFELRIKPLQARIDGVEITVQNSSNHDHDRHESRRLLTPAQQANQTSPYNRRTSQTPPSPHSHSDSSKDHNSQSLMSFPPPEICKPVKGSNRQAHTPNRGSISSASTSTPQSQNIPIASRLTNGPSQGGYTAPTPTNNIGETAHRKRTLSRESSTSRPPHPALSSQYHWPPTTAATAPSGASKSQTHNPYALQVVPRDSSPPDHRAPPPPPNYPPPHHTHDHQPLPHRPGSSVPLAKRLKNDPLFVNNYPPPISQHHQHNGNSYFIDNNEHDSYSNNLYHKNSFPPHHLPLPQYSQQDQHHHQPPNNPYNKNATHVRRRT